MSTDELEQELRALLGRRGDADTPTALVPWLLRASTHIVSGDTKRITAWGMRMLSVVLEALLVYAQDNGTIPEEVAAWIETIILPTLMTGGGTAMSAAEQEMLKTLMRLFVRLRK